MLSISSSIDHHLTDVCIRQRRMMPHPQETQNVTRIAGEVKKVKKKKKLLVEKLQICTLFILISNVVSIKNE